MTDDQPTRFLVIGGGPAGNTAATIAAANGAAVTLVESSVIGGAAHLWDCIPSKAMVASSRRMAAVRDSGALGLADIPPIAVDMERLSAHRVAITENLVSGLTDRLQAQGVDLIEGHGRLTGPNTAAVDTADGTVQIEFDVGLLSTGSRPREPAWADIDGERVITTRGAYHLTRVPEHIAVIGSGVTGVEFVHIFSSLGSEVTLLVSRQQVLPHRDSEVAAVLEEEFLERGVRLLKGARATALVRDANGLVISTDDGRTVRASHALIAIGSVPNTGDVGLDAAGIEHDHGFVTVDEYQRTNLPHIYAAGDITGQLPLSSVATLQGRKIGHLVVGKPVTPVDLRKAAQAIFTSPEIASVGLEEVDAAAQGHKVRLIKVPFASNPRSLIQSQPRGFVKVISDPATRVVLGGTIVGNRASELIGILALAVQAGLHSDVVAETLMVHPSLSESLSDAAD